MCQTLQPPQSQKDKDQPKGKTKIATLFLYNLILQFPPTFAITGYNHKEFTQKKKLRLPNPLCIKRLNTKLVHRWTHLPPTPRDRSHQKPIVNLVLTASTKKRRNIPELRGSLVHHPFTSRCKNSARHSYPFYLPTNFKFQVPHRTGT